MYKTEFLHGIPSVRFLRLFRVTMAQLSPKILLVVETTDYEGDPFLSLLIRMINKVIGFSCIRFTAIFPASNFNTKIRRRSEHLLEFRKLSQCFMQIE